MRIIVIALAILLSACSGGDDPSATESAAKVTTTTTLDPALEGPRRQYLEAVAPINAATEDFAAKLASLPSDGTQDQVAALAEAHAAAREENDEYLLQLEWPPPVRQAIEELVKADQPVIAHLRSARQQPRFSLKFFRRLLEARNADFDVASRLVRERLGLPPYSG